MASLNRASYAGIESIFKKAVDAIHEGKGAGGIMTLVREGLDWLNKVSPSASSAIRNALDL